MPIATLWCEADIVKERTNLILATQANLIHTAIADVLGGGGVFKQAIEDLIDGGYES